MLHACCACVCSVLHWNRTIKYPVSDFLRQIHYWTCVRFQANFIEKKIVQFSLFTGQMMTLQFNIVLSCLLLNLLFVMLDEYIFLYLFMPLCLSAFAVAVPTHFHCWNCIYNLQILMRLNSLECYKKITEKSTQCLWSFTSWFDSVWKIIAADFFFE